MPEHDYTDHLYNEFQMRLRKVIDDNVAMVCHEMRRGLLTDQEFAERVSYFFNRESDLLSQYKTFTETLKQLGAN